MVTSSGPTSSIEDSRRSVLRIQYELHHQQYHLTYLLLSGMVAYLISYLPRLIHLVVPCLILIHRMLIRLNPILLIPITLILVHLVLMHHLMSQTFQHHCDGILFIITMLHDISMTININMSALDTQWRHQMETFSTLLALCAGNSPVTGEFSS